ncbi:MAG: malto-oligosyltrehalose synthase [Desulfuromonas sp.]
MKRIKPTARLDAACRPANSALQRTVAAVQMAPAQATPHGIEVHHATLPHQQEGKVNPAVPEIPCSTYRLQFRREFTFEHALKILPFLQQLGISHCYASPCLQARPGSIHGYDIIDHNAINSELGGAPTFARFVSALHQQNMGLILDIVPNHMGIMGSDNVYWLDVLENGQAARYAAFFDIDWAPLKKTLQGKVLVPVLGDYYGNVLEAGEFHLRLDVERGAFSVYYFEHQFPIDPREYPRILTRALARLEQSLGHKDQRLVEFQRLICAFSNLPSRQARDQKSVAERNRNKEVHKAELARLLCDADIAHVVDETLELFNSEEGIDQLHELLENQAWLVSYWRVAADEINYRRFFDINDLAGLRMEDPAVFAATHTLVLNAIARGDVQGLRIDHPDGLYDPAGYFNMLQAQVASRLVSPHLQDSSPAAKDLTTPERPFYVVVEKILIGAEQLRQNWAVSGTTGYDFANLVNGLFVDGGAEAQMSRIYADFVGQITPLQETIYQAKKLIMRVALSSELHVLAQQLGRIAEMDRHTCDFTLSSLRDTLREIIAVFPVYRTYVQADSIQTEDLRYINLAVAAAKKKTRETDFAIFDFIRKVLSTEIAEGKSSDYRQQVITFTLKFQQYTGPVMAKGLEDTAFYRYNRLLSLNEVGGAPQSFGVSVATFHAQNQHRAENWPHAMLGSSTHDSKRSEDVRARINVLSEMPDQWQAKVRRWARINRDRGHDRGQCGAQGQSCVTPNDEYFLYQTLLGVWPLTEPGAAELQTLCSRVSASLLKAGREAKLHTSWEHPDPDYEAALSTFVEALFRAPANNPFLQDFLPFQQLVSQVGLFNSLSQTLLKLTAPGMPDIYQGNELLDFSLVDPDNRRPVDYRRRIELLDQLKGRLDAGEKRSGVVRGLLQPPAAECAKLYLTWRGLQLRRTHPELFRHGNYQALRLFGTHAEHLCAYARSYKGMLVLTLAPRLIFRLAEGKAPLGEDVWGETWVEVPHAKWTNWLTDQPLCAEGHGEVWRLPVGRILCDFPVAALCLVRS